MAGSWPASQVRAQAARTRKAADRLRFLTVRFVAPSALDAALRAVRYDMCRASDSFASWAKAAAAAKPGGKWQADCQRLADRYAAEQNRLREALTALENASAE